MNAQSTPDLLPGKAVSGQPDGVPKQSASICVRCGSAKSVDLHDDDDEPICADCFCSSEPLE